MPDRADRLTTDDLAIHPERADAAGDDLDRAEAENRGMTGHPGEGPSPEGEPNEPLLPPDDLEGYRRRWEEVQTQFVDEPRRAVEDADALVAEVMQDLAETFSSERTNLEQQWDRGDEADTEALRVTLQRYRSFFNRLLSM
jgi:hypothetical protein